MEEPEDPPGPQEAMKTFWGKAFMPDVGLHPDDIGSPGLGFLTSACVKAL